MFYSDQKKQLQNLNRRTNTTMEAMLDQFAALLDQFAAQLDQFAAELFQFAAMLD